jgi:hypothetical protein
VRDRSRETFRAAEEHKRRRRALLGAEVVLVVGFAVVTVTRLGRRRWDAVGAGAALVCLGYALAILAADGF